MERLAPLSALAAMAQADPPRNGDLFLGTTPKRAANCPATRRSGDPRQARPLSPLVARAPGSQCFPVRRSHAYDHAPRPPSHLRRILWLCSPGCGVKYAGSSKVYEGGVTGCFSCSHLACSVGNHLRRCCKWRLRAVPPAIARPALSACHKKNNAKVKRSQISATYGSTPIARHEKSSLHITTATLEYTP